MRKIVLTMVAGGLCCHAGAGSVANAQESNDVLARIAALEKENAAIRKENDALRANRALREQNVKLKSGAKPEAAALGAAPISTGKRTDPLGAYAADMPLAYKAAPSEMRGQFRVWGEGGAIWSGGDPVAQNFNLVDFTGLGALPGLGFGAQAGTLPGSFDLTPKVGWEAAAGFDYRLAGSPWHVSGQFRYGESNASALAATSGTISPLVLALLGVTVPAITTAGGNETFSAAYKEKRWLADLAVGRDIAGSGPDALQIKGGVRIAELVDTMDTSDSQHHFTTFTPTALIPGTPVISSLTTDTLTTINRRTSFLGAGPRVGIEGSVPFAGRWSFDYQGDAAVLFGTEKSGTNTLSTTSLTPSFLNPTIFNPGSTFTAANVQQFATLFNGDIQVGIAYWVTPNVKVAGSYRLDAFIHVANESGAAANNLMPDRYVHGPRVTVTGQF
jgi:hypothetical protein